MATVLTWSPDPTFRDAPAPKVFLRASWDSDTPWAEKKHLYCDGFTLCCNPEIPQATLSWRYGEILQADGTSFEKVEPLASDLIGQFVKIELIDPDDETGDNDVFWYGLIEEITDDRSGSLAATIGGGGANAFTRTGRQIVHCLGLEILLERTQITTSWTFEFFGIEQQIDRGLQFNDLRYQKEIGNMGALGTKGANLFAADLATAGFWTTLDIIYYLLKYEPPQAGLGGTEITWSPAGAFTAAPAWDKPRIATDKRTVKQVLDQVLDRRRLLGYYVRPKDDADDGSAIELHAFTFTPTDIDFGDSTIPANPDTVVLDIENSPDAEHVVLKKTAADRFDQVVVQGDRALACFSMSYTDGTLVAHWSAADQTAYNAGASGAGDYPADNDFRAARNYNYRRQDRLKRVFSYFGLPTSWDGFVKDGAGGALVPHLPFETDPTGSYSFWYPGLRFEHHLPLLLNHDYTGSKIADKAVTDTTPAGQAPEFLPMFAVGKLPQVTTSSFDGGTRWQYLEHFNANASAEIVATSLTASIRPEEDAPGVVLDCGECREALANADFSPADASDTFLNEYNSINWKTQLIVTAALKADKYCEAKWPLDAPAVQVVRRLVIDVGQEAQWHYVAPGTVIGVNDGTLQRTTSGGSIRDDRPRLQDIARFAYEWYSEERQVLELSFSLVAFGLWIGQVITHLKDARNLTTEAVNTVITQIRYEFPEASGETPPPPPRTTITTQMGQMDGLTRDALSRGRK